LTRGKSVISPEDRVHKTKLFTHLFLKFNSLTWMTSLTEVNSSTEENIVST